MRLGPYEIVSKIGVGGMGEVYRARDTRLGRDIAIKVSAERFSERFERETRAVAALNHANNRKMMAVPVKAVGATFEPGAAVPLFDVNPSAFAPYDVTADGRFVVSSLLDQSTGGSTPITVILNWQSGLKK
jgi:serine/threonine protein kinase